MVDKQPEFGRGPGRDRDNAVAQSRAQRWFSFAALVLTGAALVATSEPPQPYYSFSKSVSAPTVELTATAPRAQFLVVAEATGLAPNGNATTDSASATIAGVISATGATPFVAVRVRNVSDSSVEELSVLRDFRVPHGLAFDGDCTKLTAPPCETRFVVEFERSDGGSQGGTVGVAWSLELLAQAKSESSEGPLELPWTVEVSRQ